jgi:hypothetical protein
MNITTLIIENLRAMGATPEQITRPDGSTEIKINAPRADRERIGNNEKTENKKI